MPSIQDNNSAKTPDLHFWQRSGGRMAETIKYNQMFRDKMYRSKLYRVNINLKLTPKLDDETG